MGNKSSKSSNQKKKTGTANSLFDGFPYAPENTSAQHPVDWTEWTDLKQPPIFNDIAFHVYLEMRGFERNRNAWYTVRKYILTNSSTKTFTLHLAFSFNHY